MLNTTNMPPKMSTTTFGQRIKVREITKETPAVAQTSITTGTTVTTDASSSGSGPFSTIVGPLIKLVAVVSPGLAAWMAGNPSSAGTLTSVAGTATANATTKKVVETVIETRSPRDPS